MRKIKKFEKHPSLYSSEFKCVRCGEIQQTSDTLKTDGYDKFLTNISEAIIHGFDYLKCDRCGAMTKHELIAFEAGE